MEAKKKLLILNLVSFLFLIAVVSACQVGEVDFDNNQYLVKGMSYPEDAREFFDPLFVKLDAHFAILNNAQVTFTFELQYYNSSSARVLLHLFERLDAVAEKGNDVQILWRHGSDDDNMEEQGEEFGEDLEHAKFELVAFE